jgi:hypothetical protein
VAQPFLDFGNVGIVVESIGGGGGAQRMAYCSKTEFGNL